MTKDQKVLVTGANGYLATHIIRILLERGFHVVGTVRNQEKADKISGEFKGKPLEFVFVKDMSATDAFDKLFQEDKSITTVLHTASPLIGYVSNEETVQQAVSGVRSVLEAIKKYAPQVETVVYTSSVAAMISPKQFLYGDPTLTITEDTWNSTEYNDYASDEISAYIISKTYAEKEFWKFIKEEKPNFKGAAVNPPFIFGPLLPSVKTISDVAGSAATIVEQLTKKQPDGYDYNTLTNVFTDVRDVALSHVLVLERPELLGHRVAPIAGYFSGQQILNIANKHFPSLKGKIPVGDPSNPSGRLSELFKYNTSKTDKFLGIKWIPLEQSVVDTFHSVKDFEKNF